MPRPSKSHFVNCLAVAVLFVAAAPCDRSIAAEGSGRSAGWTVSTEDQDHPSLRYSDGRKTVFMMGCGYAFEIWAAYPDKSKRPRKVDEKAFITIENGRSQTNLAGVVRMGSSDELPSDTAYFVQSDLGYDHNSRATYGPAWQKRETRLFDFLDSGQSLTISGAGKVYVLPAIRIADWKARLKKTC